MDAYRAIYHNDPGSPRADASIIAVADLLAEEGRLFQDDKALHNSIAQYEFLRNQYPGSRFRFSALLTEGEIYQSDLNDPAQAKTAYQLFLRLYPRSPLADEARVGLKNIRRGEVSARSGRNARRPADHQAVPAEAAGGVPATRSRHNTVLTAAIGSQQNAAPPARTPETAHAAAPTRQSTAPAQQSSLQPQRNSLQESDIPATPTPTAPASPYEEPAHMSEAELNAPPPPRRKGLAPLVTGIRYWSTPGYTRVAIDLQDEVRYEAARVPNPDRIFFDLYGVRLSPELTGKSVQVTDDGFLTRIRAAQFSNEIARIVLDVNSVSEYSAFFLPNPPRLIIDVHGGAQHNRPPVVPPGQMASNTTPRTAVRAPAVSTPSAGGSSTLGIGPASTDTRETAQTTRPPVATVPHAAQRTTTASIQHTGRPVKPSPTVVVDDDDDSSSLADVASLSRQPDTVKATRHPTRAPVVASVSGTQRETQSDGSAVSTEARNTSPSIPSRATRRTAGNSTTTGDDSAPPVDAGATGVRASGSWPEPLPNGQRSMMRALGLKINRIVIDAGHGGHDSGTLGPGGIEEKDVVLDVALRLGKLLKQRLGADVIYTRDDDTFIPLETRTAIANKAQADLFISIHANSSPDASARGVETYYLNFTTSADALEVAARENAVSDESIHQLSDLVKKIALQDKINESREFASDVEDSLYTGLERGNPGLKDRGVKKAPFVVLIGANMPSILAEISFLTNPDDAQELRESTYRERIAESLYRGVSKYVGSLNGVRIAENTAHGDSN
ncbi:N-acetylmuramoyl-L-alanine amidase [Acidipila sp. 4G-K13]|uniref:N-acetylmuramoyl-L-alanine amidase n=2 Tax=Paracidobacterium acidisoli TaxID=2303751 RepID=A0A372INV4_9BACT|nr:N-acetylmuramoyl-L-alanine amidase [Paracidobacterium acidisoli]